ncbi:MAG: hypothetical protein VX311_09425 [Planctomycetota bacterium]|nr:hypothetical protein [Planctomycetota bacterium]
MSTTSTDWSQNGRGQRHPVAGWTYPARSAPTAVDIDLETGDVTVVTEDGRLHLLGSDGRLRADPLALEAGPALAWADSAIGGVVQLGARRAGWVSRDGKVQWTVDCHDQILDVATAPFGNAIAISFADRHNVVLDNKQKPIGEFTSIRPLKFLELASHRPVVVGAAESGVLSSHTISGNDRWSEQIWTNVGGMALNGNCRTILLAAFNHGLQRFNHRGRGQGFYDIGGTAHAVSISYIGTIIAAATQEQQFRLLDFDGSILWQAQLPEPLVTLQCGPFGEHVVFGFSTGLIQCLKWPPWGRKTARQPDAGHADSS